MARAAKITLALILVAIIGLVVFVNTLDVNQYKSEIIQAADRATGRKLTINGDMKISLLLSPSITVQDVTFSNASWGSKPNMLSMHEMQLQVAWLPLLSGDIQIKRLVLVDPDILLETNKQGTGNWQLSSTKKVEKPKQNTGSAPVIAFSDIKVKNAKISYINGVTDHTSHIDINEIDTQSSGFDEPLALTAKASINNIPLMLSGQVGSITQWQTNSQFPVDLKLTLGDDLNLTVKGAIETPASQPKLDLAINGSADSLASLNQLAQSKFADIGPLKLSAQLNSDNRIYSLTKMNVQLAKTVLSGKAKADLTGSKPDISGNITAKSIDLAAISGEKTEKQDKKASNQHVFSSTPLPLAGLQAVNANIQLDAAQIKTKKITLSKTVLGVSLKNGVMTIKPLSSTVAGGALNGSVTLNASGKTPALVADINIKGLQPGQIGGLAKHIADAKTDIAINIKGKGDSVSQIMAGLNGNILLHSGQGALTVTGANLVGTDILTMLNPVVKSKKNTQLQCAVINFNVKDGLATADKGIALMTDQMNVVGSGTIDLKSEKLDIGLKPHAREGLGVSVGQLADFVRVGGTLANPQPTTDVTSALSTGLKVQTAVATGGLSLLAQGLFDKITADDNPCNTALGIKSAQSDNQTNSATSNDKAVKPAKKDAGSSITDTLKGLFN